MAFTWESAEDWWSRFCTSKLPISLQTICSMYFNNIHIWHVIRIWSSDWLHRFVNLFSREFHLQLTWNTKTSWRLRSKYLSFLFFFLIFFSFLPSWKNPVAVRVFEEIMTRKRKYKRKERWNSLAFCVRILLCDIEEAAPSLNRFSHHELPEIPITPLLQKSSQPMHQGIEDVTYSSIGLHIE